MDTLHVPALRTAIHPSPFGETGELVRVGVGEGYQNMTEVASSWLHNLLQYELFDEVFEARLSFWRGDKRRGSRSKGVKRWCNSWKGVKRRGSSWKGVNHRGSRGSGSRGRGVKRRRGVGRLKRCGGWKWWSPWGQKETSIFLFHSCTQELLCE